MTALLPALALLGAVAGATERQMLSLDPSSSVVRFHVDHKMHKVDGLSRSVEGKAVIEPDGRVLAMVRIPIASFDSGDANRDSHMRETLDASHHPFVVFKGVTSMAMPAAQGSATPTLKGELDFHGVKHAIEVPVSVEFASDGSATVKGKMEISLDGYGVERPSLLFVKVEDACAIQFDLKMRRTQ